MKNSQVTEVSFYHLTKTPFEKALPNLLEKIISSGSRAVITLDNKDNLLNINNFLWSFSTNRVVPHGIKEDGFEKDQPVYLTVEDENPNSADVIVLADGKETDFIKKFSKCVDIFDGNNPETLENARKRWKKLSKSPDFTLTYWKQSEKGGWESESAKNL